MYLKLILITLFAMACSSKPTPYGPSEKNQGYADKTVDHNLRMASFQGNSATKKETAELFAKFRAIEICRDLKRTYTHILMVKDKTYSKQTTQELTPNPSYYYGVSPYYGRYGGYNPGMGGIPITTVSNETYTYPVYEVYFECVEKPMDARVSLINITNSLMQTLVKDLKGGVQVEEVLSDSPNVGVIQKGDIIFMAGGERVQKVIEVYQASRKFQGNNFNVEFFRDGVKKEATIKFSDVSLLVGQAQKEIIRTACKKKDIEDKKSICKEIKKLALESIP